MRQTTKTQFPFLVMLGCLAATFLPLPTSSAAQESPPLERLEVAIWPEYDQPSVLVILRAFLPADSLLPATISLPMPLAAGQPTAVAKRGLDGGLLNAQFLTETVGDQTEVRISTDTREVRLEYYLPMVTTEEQRKLALSWRTAAAIGAVFYEFLQPPGAGGVALSPPPTSQGIGANGLQHWFGSFGSVAAGEAFSMDIGYTKADATLTVAALQQETQAPSVVPPVSPSPKLAEVEAPPPGLSIWWVVLAAALAVVALVAWIALSAKRSG